jgi:tetratricopeptide (TPR) repeat protein
MKSQYVCRLIVCCLSGLVVLNCISADDKRTADPNFEEIHSGREAPSWKTRGLLGNEAIHRFSEIISNDPNKLEGYDLRGATYFTQGEWDKAIDDFSKALQIDPGNARVYANRAAAYRFKKEFDKAIADFSESLRLNPTNHAAYNGRAAIHMLKREFELAIPDWNEGLRLYPDDANAVNSRGYAYYMTGQFEKAAQDYKRAIDLNPSKHLAYNNLAWLRATCVAKEFRDGKEAVAAATKACELTDWARGDWIDTLAAAYAELGDFKNATKYQRMAIRSKDVSDADRKILRQHLRLYQNGRCIQDGQKEDVPPWD